MGMWRHSEARDQRLSLSVRFCLLTSLRCTVLIPCPEALINLYNSFRITAIHAGRFSVLTQVDTEGHQKHASQMGLTVSGIAGLGKDSEEFVGKPPPDENVILEDLFPLLAHSEITFSQPPFFLRAGDLFH